MQNSILKQKKNKNFNIFGTNYKLISKNGINKNSIQIDGNNVILNLKENCTEKQYVNFIKNWYRNILKDEIDIILPYLERKTNIHCSTYGTRNMLTRWGSCSIKSKKIWLNLQLVQKPKKCLEYVILHELLHTKFSKHTQEFKKLQEQFMPDWKEYHSLLNEENI